MVSVILVNNETGAVNPVKEIAGLIKKRGLSPIIHTDAVQALCKVDINVKELGADLISLSSHKIHGPKGCGALYIKKGVKLGAFIEGGGCEETGCAPEPRPCRQLWGLAVLRPWAGKRWRKTPKE